MNQRPALQFITGLLMALAIVASHSRAEAGILSGGDTAATEYFRRATQDALRKRFLPIVARATSQVELAEKYNQYADTAVAFGLVRKEDANLDDYVTQKALDGLFFMVAEEEKKIRKDPVGAASAIIRKVFGAIR